MANRKTRALRRAEYLRQREAMDAQAREAVATQAVSLCEEEEKHGDSSVGEVCQQIQLIPLACIRALSADEINTYLTFIFCTDRTQEGCVEAHIANGVLPALMRRIVELEESK